MSNITVGPALEIGGNTVEMTTKGKVQVTNSKGRIKTLSQDEFKKNLIKNADKINEGEDFEFKKDHKGLKIAAAAVATTAVVTAAIYHKEIGKYMKDFSFKKLWKDVKGLFKSLKDKVTGKKQPATIYDKTALDSYVLSKNEKFADEAIKTKQLKDGLNAKLAKDYTKGFEKCAEIFGNDSNRIHKANQKYYDDIFSGIKEDVLPIVKRAELPEAEQMMLAEERLPKWYL